MSDGHDAMVRDVLTRALEALEDEGANAGGIELDAARTWLARTESLLRWAAQHPGMVAINCEASTLVQRYGPDAE